MIPVKPAKEVKHWTPLVPAKKPSLPWKPLTPSEDSKVKWVPLRLIEKPSEPTPLVPLEIVLVKKANLVLKPLVPLAVSISNDLIAKKQGKLVHYIVSEKSKPAKLSVKNITVGQDKVQSSDNALPQTGQKHTLKLILLSLLTLTLKFVLLPKQRLHC